MKPRVLFVLGGLAAGGIATSTVRLAAVLAKHVSIDLLVLSGRVKDVPLPPGVFHQVRFLDEAGLFRPYQLLRLLRVLRDYLAFVEERDYKCAVAFGEIPGLFGAVGRLSRCHAFVAGVRTAWRSEARHRARRSPLKYHAYRALSYLVYSTADRVVGVTRSAVAQVADEFRLPPEKVRYIYNYVDHEALTLRAREDLAPDEVAFFGSGEPVIVAMGRLERQKGFDILLSALSLLHTRGCPASLIIMGKGEHQRALESFASDLGLSNHVVFAGHRQNPHRIIARADVFVMPSRWEGIANALVEAILCGPPIIATDCPAGPREILTTETGNLLGRLVPPEDPPAMAQALIEVLQTPIRPARWSSLEGTSLAEMSEAHVTQRWLAMFEELPL